ncbi:MULTISPECIES: NUDIX domain-containing protein [unclassified Streptomyces]|uniref:NUDIX domain-containing protein n=1 Tax=unclassified Streptomyces TaxID=2593676 RepID=UPI0001C1995A|nr:MULTISPECIES: NUDIX domain-containing protein [unclassified Streptomyces]AEN13425.1 NUDIX hydrolase [Streptomyces sp. SirexAA-E]MYR68028.1 NUDIX domain-containing protein [Streptomyces sp. SID4939]MYS00006.1 NUDIX domain-containing protein [Streptomyces sp. SID4940]MYT67127.1 NUDIX domain-containing protein [Streptomyces sp. SID8357]MYT84771.1 NUDIX domain-containing protein [Streptomyces sp. SID8360]
MSEEPVAVDVRFDRTGLVVARDPDGTCHLPRRGQAPDGSWCSLPPAEALHARLRPTGTAEKVLRDWVTGGPTGATAPWDDPAAVAPVRVRAGAVVLREDRMLLIGFEEDGQPYYEIPGGGVEDGESAPAAAVRELREETGLRGEVVREVARVWKDGRREHYFLLAADGDTGAPEELDNQGGTPVWIPVDRLPATPLWPRRLAWRIAHWHTAGWPERPAELADSIHDLAADCTW